MSGNYKIRYAYFDYIKFILIFLVVFGHLMENYTNNTLIKTIYLFIYSFHMPLFVLISGIFAKYNKERILQLLLIYLLFNYSIQLVNCLTNLPQNLSFSQILTELLTPQWAMWFVLALPIWLYTTKFIKVVKPIHIFYATILALLVGFLPFIDRVLSLSRIFYFYPFFLLGKMIGQNKEKFVNKIKSIQNIKTTTFTIFVLIAIFTTLACCQTHLPIEFFYGSTHYTQIIDILFRSVALFLGFVGSFAIILIVPAKSKGGKHMYSISSIGQRTFSIYLIHVALINAIYALLALLDTYFYTTILFGLIVTIITIVLTSMPFLNKFINSIKV